MWEIITIIYLVCCVLGIIFSISRMLTVIGRRKFVWTDMFAAIFFTISGPLGILIIIHFCIELKRDQRRKKRIQHVFGDQGEIL